MTSSGTAGRLLFVAANPSIDRLYELDRLNPGEIHRPRSVTVVAGGKGLNAARAAAALGGTVTAVGVVAGRAGDWIVERLAALGIAARMSRANGETRTCVSILDRSSGALTEVYERGEAIEPAAWEALEAIVAEELAVGDVAAVTVSGSVARGAPADAFGRISRLAAAGPRPVPVLADTYGPALEAVLVERPTVVKVNATEAAESTAIPVSGPATAGEAADTLRGAGASQVIVTLGLDGAVVVSAAERIRLAPPAVRGAYPVGSGDAFLGGLAVALARGTGIVEAARLGLAAGIANALVPGAGNLDPADVERIVAQVVPTPL